MLDEKGTNILQFSAQVRRDIRDENIPRPLGKRLSNNFESYRAWTEKGTTVLGNPQAGCNNVDAVWRGIQPS